MDVRCPTSRHLLFRVKEAVDLGTEIEIRCVCKRSVTICDPRTPQLTETRTPLRSESFPREEMGYASTEFSTGLRRSAAD